MKQILFSLICCISISAAPPEVTTRLIPDTLTIGDRIEYCVNLEVPKGTLVVPPDPGEGWGGVALKNFNIAKKEKASVDSISIRYQITTYSTDPCTIPELPIFCSLGSDTDTSYAPVRFFQANSVISNLKEGETLDIQDVGQPLSAGKPSYLWLWMLLSLLGLGVAIWLIRRYIVSKRVPPPPPPPPPPYDEAITALGVLEAKQYLVLGMFKEFVFELSDIVKRYIGRRYEVNAEDFTSQELIDWLYKSIIDSENRKRIELFIKGCDPIKFAKALADRDRLESYGHQMRDFFNATRPMPEVVSAGKDAHPKG